MLNPVIFAALACAVMTSPGLASAPANEPLSVSRATVLLPASREDDQTAVRARIGWSNSPGAKTMGNDPDITGGAANRTGGLGPRQVPATLSAP